MVSVQLFKVRLSHQQSIRVGIVTFYISRPISWAWTLRVDKILLFLKSCYISPSIVVRHLWIKDKLHICSVWRSLLTLQYWAQLFVRWPSQAIHWMTQFLSLILIRWIVSYPVDGAIHLLNIYFNCTYTKILTILSRAFYTQIVFLNLWSFFLSVTLTSRRRQLLIFNSRWKLKIIHIQLYIKIHIYIHTITIIINY